MEEAKGNVFERIAHVANLLGPIKKKQPKPGGGINYAFRGIDDLMNNIQPLFAAAGLFLIPETVRVETDVIVQNNGTKDQYVTRCNLEMKWTIFAIDGSHVSGSVPGHASDYSDKAVNKAISNSLKYFLMDTFLIPTEDIADGDTENPEINANAKPVTPNKYTGDGDGTDEAASEKQLNMIKFLLNNKTVDEKATERIKGKINSFSKAAASETIAWLNKQTDKAK